jgi:hypothetical protein
MHGVNEDTHYAICSFMEYIIFIHTVIEITGRQGNKSQLVMSNSGNVTFVIGMIQLK